MSFTKHITPKDVHHLAAGGNELFDRASAAFQANPGPFKKTIKFDDADVALAALTATIDVPIDGGEAVIVKDVYIRLVEVFTGIGLASLTIEVGEDATPDPDAFLTAQDGTATLGLKGFASGDKGAALAGTGFIPAGGKLRIVLTAAGINLDALTRGEVEIIVQHGKP